MKNLKSILSILLSITMLAIVVSSCGSSSGTETKEGAQTTQSESQKDTDKSSESSTKESTTKESATKETTKEATKEATTEEPTTEEPTTEETGTKPFAEKVHIRAGAFEGSKAMLEIWENLVGPLKEQNIELEVVSLTPKEGVSIYQRLIDEDLDFVLGQTVSSFYGNTEYNKDLYDFVCPVWYTYALCYNMYSTKFTSVEEIPDGARILISDVGLQHGLRVLESAGFIKCNEEMQYYSFTNFPTDEQKQVYILQNVAENTKNLTFSFYNETMPGAYGAGESEYDAMILSEMIGTQFKYQYGSLKLIFEDPLTDEDYIPAMFGHKDAVNDPEKRAVVERVRDFWQSQITLNYMKKINLMNKPAGWDIDLLEKYK